MDIETANDITEPELEQQRTIKVSAAVRLLGVSRTTVYEYIKRGQLTKLKLKGTDMTRLRLAEVLDLIEVVHG